MRRMVWTAAVILCVTLVMTACGTKDAESVVKDLDKVVNNMESYQGNGTMTLHTGQQPLEYQVEVSYQKPSFYRIKLTNEEKDITQIVLRNDEGVFVLTPKLNKVFRFQSDWPQNQGQVYLYQTLIQSILVDGSRQFAADDDSYVFDVMANYNNGTLARQKIWLNKSDLSPQQVEVTDTNASVMVDVKFDTFKFGAKFDTATFETEANMNAAPSSGEELEEEVEVEEQETIATPEQNTDDPANEDDEVGSNPDDDANVELDDDASAEISDNPTSPFFAFAPAYFPEGVMQKDMTDIVFGGNAGLMTRFEGIYSYTLIQTQPKDKAASLVAGTMMNLGSTVGEMTVGEDLQTLTWIYKGNEFRLSSADLPESEMIKVAQSVVGEIGK